MERPLRTTTCPRCRQSFEDWFASCPFCEAPQPRHDRGPVLIAIFLGLGALAVPGLLRSRAFTPREKLWLSVAAIAYTTTMIAIIVVIFRFFLSLYRDMLGPM